MAITQAPTGLRHSSARYSIKGSNTVRLNVEMIGQAIAVDVDKDYLDMLD